MAALTEDQINTHIQNIHTALAAMVATPKVSYSIEGNSFSWGEYYRLLMDQMAAYKAMLGKISWEETTYVRDW